MNIDWTAVLVALLGSNLLIEIWKTIKESIKKKRRLDVESEINNLKKLLSDSLSSINEKLSNDYSRLNSIERTLELIAEVLSRDSEGTILSLQNDAIIFEALRNHHINGESEAQEKKLQEYYKKCAEFNLKLH